MEEFWSHIISVLSHTGVLIPVWPDPAEYRHLAFARTVQSKVKKFNLRISWNNGNRWRCKPHRWSS